MNSEKVQTIINEIISDLHARIGGKAARKQYPVSKHQIETLTELGIIELMPKGFGHADAKAVIEEAQRSSTAVMNAYGEGEEIGSSKLYQALNEVETPELTDEELDNFDTPVLVIAESEGRIAVELFYNAPSIQEVDNGKVRSQCSFNVFRTDDMPIDRINWWLDFKAEQLKLNLANVPTFTVTKGTSNYVYGGGFPVDTINKDTLKTTLKHCKHYGLVRLV